MKLKLRQLIFSIFFLSFQLNAQPFTPEGDGNDALKKEELAYKKPLGLHLDTLKINLVTKGQFRLFDNSPFEIHGDTFSKAIPVQDRFGNSCPNYYLRKTVFNRQAHSSNTITIFKERAVLGGFVEYVIEIPTPDTLRPILVIEKPRFTLTSPFKARWVSAEELYRIIWKDGTDKRHYLRQKKHDEKGKVAQVF